MKYKVGDKVKIRRDLIAGEQYGYGCAVPMMMRYRGEECTILQVYEPSGYTLKETPSCLMWTNEMFEDPDGACISRGALRKIVEDVFACIRGKEYASPAEAIDAAEGRLNAEIETYFEQKYESH